MSDQEVSMQLADIIRNSEFVSLGVKLDSHNYLLWARLMKVAICGRGRLNHITGDPVPLVIWDSLAATYGGGADPFIQYDLEIRANKVSQGEANLEDYWSELQKVWMNIDRNNPSPIDCCEKGIKQYQTIINQRRLYQFLSGLDKKFDPIRKEILKESPSPSAISAFADVRREATRLKIFQSATNSDVEQIGSIGASFALRPSKPISYRSDQTSTGAQTSRQKIDKSKLHYIHCGNKKHTKEMCFELVVYPEWWEENPKSVTRRGKSVVGLTRGERQDASQLGGDVASRLGGDVSLEVGNAGFGGAVVGDVDFEGVAVGDTGSGSAVVQRGGGVRVSDRGQPIGEATIREHSDEGDYWTWH